MNNQTMDWSQNLSSTIDILRFPLAIAVIFIHIPKPSPNVYDTDLVLFSGEWIYNVIAVSISYVLTHIAVPTFFLISGFLFFRNFAEWSWDGYRRKMRSRVMTLLVPYLVWNLLTIGLLLLRGVLAGLESGELSKTLDMIAAQGWHLFYDCNVWGESRVNVLGWFQQSSGPVCLPLWFLRDLIVATAFAPVIWWLVKKARFAVVALLFAAYCTRIWPVVPGFSINAFFFYTIGAYCALEGKNIVIVARKYLPLCGGVALCLFPVCVYYNSVNTVIGNNIYPFFVASAVFAAFAVASKLVERYGMKAHPVLVKSCFFVYACHATPVFITMDPMAIVNRALHFVIPGNSMPEFIVVYLLNPFLTAALCCMLYVLLTRYVPRVATLFTGGR